MATYKMKKADNKTTINVNILTEFVEVGKAVAKERGLSFTAYLQECLALGNLSHRLVRESAMNGGDFVLRAKEEIEAMKGM